MQFSFSDMTALEPHLGQAFKFSPAAATKLFLKTHNVTDAPTNGYRFYFLYFSNYLKIHLKFHL